MSLQPVNSTSFDMSSLPTEIGLRIFSNLNAQDLAIACLVSKFWNALTKNEHLLDLLDLKTLFKRVTFIDEAVWKDHVDLGKYGLSFGEYFVKKSKMIPELKRCLSWPIENINGIESGVTVVTIPQGLSLKKLRDLAFQVFFTVSDHYEDVEVDQPYTIIISDSVIEGTREKKFEQQLEVIEKYEGAKPKAIEVITQLILKYLIFGQRLYPHKESQDYLTFTNCEEGVRSKRKIVGNFSPFGFTFTLIFASHSKNIGLAALRRLDD